MRLFSFDRRAKSYFASSEVQKFFAKHLAQKITQKWGKSFLEVLDLGCGVGILPQALAEEGISIALYRGCDISPSMLKYFQSPYPKSILLHQDFDQCLTEDYKPELIASSSALQWSSNLSHTFSLIAKHRSKVALSLMGSNTFRELHGFLGTKSPLMEVRNMRKLLLEFFSGEIEILHQELAFDSSDILISHLRNSGVMGGGVIGYKKAKKLLEYAGKLEYEGIFFLGCPK